jgi:hypothetical protein
MNCSVLESTFVLVRGHTSACVSGMKLLLTSPWRRAILAVALTLPLTLGTGALRAEDKNAKTYHDKEHNDDHHWDAHEDQAYKIYAKENHRKAQNFQKLKEEDQQNYWKWRHEHSDAVLKIDIH